MRAHAAEPSAVLPGTTLAVTPLPDSYDALPQTQISLLGAAAKAIHDVSVRGSVSGYHSGRLRAYSQGDGASFVPSAPFVSGETVTVKGSVDTGSRRQSFAFHFVVAREDTIPRPPFGAPLRVPVAEDALPLAAEPAAAGAWSSRPTPPRRPAGTSSRRPTTATAKPAR